MKPITEDIIEQLAIELLQSQGWEYANGRELSPEGLFCERENYQQIILTKYGYPPDKQQKAIDTVLKQAELMADNLEL